ncbi:uncharacterized protein LOC134718616 [Mytilus trossulus]|uniref:uncharacterized protein LOC134718616 n=1 Tax=Mytilus trossulus TaxID=6551 RepID=UPI0030043FA5
MMELDFSDRNVNKISYSYDDKRFISILDEGISVENGHYVMPLPFKDKNPPILPNNKNIAVTRLNQLKGRLQRDKTYRTHYFTSMNDFIEKGYVEKVESSKQDNDGHVWYIPHHGVYHNQKPDKVRVVFDCSARYQGHSLNDHLLQGPDLTNKLIGVLCRFRKENIAVICDIEQMFLQFNVNKDHRDYLRFLWWKDDNLHEDPIEYRMNVHLFGAASSPGCANFGLKRVADDYEDEFGSDISDFLRYDFYVDDGLKSVASIDDAVNLVKRSREMCNKVGLKLHKFQSNSKELLNLIPIEDRAKDLKNLVLLNDKLPITKTLGIQWCIESDSFQFRIELTNKPLTRRGILSTLSSVYDPLGFLSPFVLLGKQILQECCSDQIDWDEPPSEILIQRWQQWRNDIQNLAQLGIQRCVKPKNFGNITVCELHHFSDASTLGYGQCSYLRLIDENGLIHCTLLMGKARVTPRRLLTIPRLELSAAIVSIRISQLLKQELQYENITEWFWTDSNIVLGYIANDNRRFHIFVENRVQQIREHSSPTQWKYIDTKENPADVASRGASANDLVKNSNWFTGPKFLWTLQSFDADANTPDLSLNDPEIRIVKTFSTKMDVIEFASMIERLEYFSSWNHAKRAVSICLKLKDTLRSQTKSKNQSIVSTLCVNDMQRAEIEIIKQLQSSSFSEEIAVLQSMGEGKTYEDRQSTRIRNIQLKRTSSLYKLDPFLDSDGIIRVGGRIRRAEFNLAVKHPVIIPRHSHVTELIIRHFHEKAEHQGRGMTINEIRANGFWIIGCSTAVSKYLATCVICRKHRSNTQEQKMADLPSDRLDPVPPFTYSGVDLFGPWYIKEGRKELKRYGVLFTCLSCRGVHIETANSLDTSSFINALRRFIAIRGPVRHLRSDRGTNFVGAERELREAYSEMDDKSIRQFLSNEGCDFVEFKMNVSSASHMGGVWERQIRSVRNVLASLMHQSGTQLDDESLRTFMCEAAAIVNSRPLTLDNLNDPLSEEPLTPNHILTMKSKIILPPPGQFQRSDIYSRKRWRRVQFLANEFWNRWRKEYLSNLQSRKKWTAPRRNLQVGDIVMIKDEQAARNQWHLGKINTAHVDEDGLVRKVRVTIGAQIDNSGRRNSPLHELDRPIQKLVLVLEVGETEEVPTEEPNDI